MTIWRSGAVGDFILTLPALRALKTYASDCPMRLIGTPAITSLFEAEIAVDSQSIELLPLHMPNPHAQNEAFFTACRHLLVYGQAQGPLYDNARNALRDDQVLFWPPMPPPNGSLHITDHLLAPLKKWLDISTLDPRPSLDLTAECFRKAAIPTDIPSILAHPGSSAETKCWPIERFVKWAHRLQAEGIDVGFISGPIESERGVSLPEDIPHIVPPDLHSLAVILQRTRFFVGNDSGPGHIAAAVGTPTLTLFGPTDPRIWAPRRETSRVLIAPRGDLTSLSVQTVVEATKLQLNRPDQ